MLKTAAYVIASLVLAASPALSDDWPQFRGPNRDGISAEKGLLTQWPEGGPKLLWSVKDVGQGFTQVVVSNGLVYVTGLVGRDGVLRAYTPEGELKWQTTYGPEWFKSHPGARSIPTVHDGLIYLSSGFGNVYCLNAADGKPVWSAKVFEDYDAPEVMWGFAESLLVVGDKVICTPVGKKALMVALDRKTGKTVWASPPFEGATAYCSPVLVKHGGRSIIVTMVKSAVIAVSPEDGKLLWQFPYTSKYSNYPDTPIYRDGMLYITSGYTKGAVGLELAPDGLSVKLVWEQSKQDPVHGQAVLVNGYVYASSHQSSKLWSCVEFKTGKLMWEDQSVGKGGSIISADGMLYCYSEDGNVGLIKPSPKRCIVVSSFKVPLGDGDHWAHPVVANGRLYIRHGNALMCYDVSAAK